MLVPSKRNQEVVVVGGIRTDGRKPMVTILEHKGGNVRPRCEVDSDVPVDSEEILARIRAAAGETC
jgi:sRNA-binding carbon storage regulator CsrA